MDLVSAIQNRGLGCGLFRNKMLVGTVTVSFLVQLGLVYVPFMQSIFYTTALPLRDLFVLLSLGAGSAVLHEFRRAYERKINRDELRAHTMQELV
jgi:Cation transport ATPase